MIILDLLLVALAAVLLVPAVVYAAECVLAPKHPRSIGAAGEAETRTFVVVPAHDEAGGIGPTVAHLKSQLGPSDRLIVVADNCTDETARIAGENGAEVLERTDPDNRGKGFALNYAFGSFRDEPPDVVLIMDADCRLEPGSYSTLVTQAAATARPAQAEYLMRTGDDSAKSALSAFAFLVRNVVRPRGLDRLGMPCHLTGTGMAFPWPALEAVPLPGGHIVEDLVHGLDLITHGFPPRLCPGARVWSELPEGSDASLKQRSRWEHGQLHTLATRSGKMISEGLRRGRLDVLALGLDLSVPPLAFFVLVLLAALFGTGVLALLGATSVAANFTATALTLVGVATLVAWARFGRHVLPWHQLLAIPVYVIWKIPVYVALLVGKRTRQWQRTERTSERDD